MPGEIQQTQLGFDLLFISYGSERVAVVNKEHFVSVNKIRRGVPELGIDPTFFVRVVWTGGDVLVECESKAQQDEIFNGIQAQIVPQPVEAGSLS